MGQRVVDADAAGGRQLVQTKQGIRFGASERRYEFFSTDRLLADFNADIARWNHENGRA